MSDRAKAKVAPELEKIDYYPTRQVKGVEWIVDALNDLADYCAYNQLSDVETTLRRTIWEASLQLKHS
jgi:hypothetical protein